jgi:RNA polymerase sigma-70 factor (ECF subfamily)
LIALTEDKELVDGCISGKRDAQYALYRKYSKAMYNICLRMVNDKSEAEDVLQNAFIDIFTKMKYFRYESTPGAWIKRIVINNCINHLRRNKAETVSLDQVAISEMDYEPDVSFNLNVIKNAIGQLPEGYRVIFCLYTIEGYDHGEIAEIMQITESTSKSQYSRARAKLYNILKSSGDIDKIYE